jgi:hypothetical protein
VDVEWDRTRSNTNKGCDGVGGISYGRGVGPYEKQHKQRERMSRVINVWTLSGNAQGIKRTEGEMEYGGYRMDVEWDRTNNNTNRERG